MITSTYRTKRYYRGYSLIQLLDRTWNICWGDILDNAPTLADAEAVVDNWVEDGVR